MLLKSRIAWLRASALCSAEIDDFAAFVALDRAGAMTGAIANLSCGTLVD